MSTLLRALAGRGPLPPAAQHEILTADPVRNDNGPVARMLTGPYSVADAVVLRVVRDGTGGARGQTLVRSPHLTAAHLPEVVANAGSSRRQLLLSLCGHRSPDVQRAALDMLGDHAAVNPAHTRLVHTAALAVWAATETRGELAARSGQAVYRRTADLLTRTNEPTAIASALLTYLHIPSDLTDPFHRQTAETLLRFRSDLDPDQVTVLARIAAKAAPYASSTLDHVERITRRSRTAPQPRGNVRQLRDHDALTADELLARAPRPLLTNAEHKPNLCLRLCEILTVRLGDDPIRWELLGALFDELHGPLGDLLGTVDALGSAASS